MPSIIARLVSPPILFLPRVCPQQRAQAREILRRTMGLYFGRCLALALLTLTSCGRTEMSETIPPGSMDTTMADSGMAMPDTTEAVSPGPHHSHTTTHHAGAPSPEMAAVDRALAGLEDSNIAFNTPPSMAVGEVSEIEVVLSLTEAPATLAQEVHAPGTREVHPVKVSSRMEARLTSPGFTILAIGPEAQAISATEPTRWRWNVRAVEEGDQQLHLTLTALIEVNGSTTPRALNTFDHTIRVRVTMKERVAGFVGNNWQWLWSVIVVPGALWAAGRWRKFKKPEGGTA